MKLLVAALLLTAGCASSHAVARAQPAQSVILPAVRVACTLLGEPVYNPRSGFIDPLTTFGPSKIIWVHPGDHILTLDHGYIYECTTRT